MLHAHKARMDNPDSDTHVARLSLCWPGRMLGRSEKLKPREGAHHHASATCIGRRLWVEIDGMV